MFRAFLIIAAWFCLTSLHAGVPQTVVVFGDSITAGSSLPKADKDKVWVNLVGKQSAGRLNMINEGKGGRPTDSIKEFTEMLARRKGADMLVLALGGNDARDISVECVPKAERNLRAMVELARKNWPAGLRIAILGPTNIRKDALGPTRPIADQRDDKLQELNTAFEKLAKELRCDYLSLYGIIPAASLTADGVHPDVAGNEAIAKAVSPLLLTR